MDRCDVLIVGGGPAGSSSAWRLGRAGLDVVVLDKARFPRDKVCAGWITPAVVEALELDLDAYRRGRTLQPFTGFRTGPLDRGSHLTEFAATISHGIRRCEFDDYLLRRSGARVRAGESLADLRRDGTEWVVNDAVRAPVVIGAGGHFCPVARQVNGTLRDEPVVIAQEVEFPLDADQASSCPVRGEWPELFFWSDLSGYGWCIRKGAFLNVGIGRLTRSQFPAAVKNFATTLHARGALPDTGLSHWKGHAYLLAGRSSRRLSDDGVLLVGDAAGLALAPSGEGILAAVESGLMAADVVLRAGPSYGRDRLVEYDRRIGARFGPRALAARQPRALPRWLLSTTARTVLQSPWLTRRYLLERWFLHVGRPALS